MALPLEPQGGGFGCRHAARQARDTRGNGEGTRKLLNTLAMQS